MGGVFTRRKGLQNMQMDMRLKARKKTSDQIPAGEQIPVGKKLAVKAQRVLRYSVNSEHLKGFSGAVMQRAEATQKAALSVQKRRKKPARIPMIALMTLMKRQVDARTRAPAPVLRPLMAKQEIRGTLESARQTMALFKDI